MILWMKTAVVVEVVVVVVVVAVVVAVVVVIVILTNSLYLARGYQKRIRSYQEGFRPKIINHIKFLKSY